MRGNPYQRMPPDRRGRSIPACAGEPPGASGGRREGAVYPRVCGGTVIQRQLLPHAAGLSPRVRGNQDLPTVQYVRLRSIPACAGEPAGSLYQGQRCPVYPRVCGGTQGIYLKRAPIEGLSPRVRGNPALLRHHPQLVRSIPACAGEPGSRAGSATEGEVYPRVCGGTNKEVTLR